MLFKDEEVILILIAGTAMLMLLGVFIVSFLLVYQRKQNKNMLEKEHLKSSFQQELLKTRMEIQEETLNYVSRELHDNVTQVLSFVKLNLGVLGKNLEETEKVKINDNRELISQSISDLRNLSKSLSFEHISAIGLVKTLEMEAERINRSGIINLLFLVDGDVYPLGEQRELVLFRIFQEALNNVLKHAEAANFKISLYYKPQMFNLTIEDDGVGFQPELLNDKSGSGLRNIINRAALIGAEAVINSTPGNGCNIKLSLNPLVQETYANGTHSNSPG
ncbi:sensor histidine kinase [Mucilaginibacter pocheonensis]|uniref:histidine kinase n=1 Tax=Mucilaginibacter pocheonensis TaxID=398050 RepID=A0ABU1TAM8_9SPHI|nr:ATP-binding protein [Mucilaginibacter pocheonensis]MDR6941926.1 signal transduction histidine kinase [Mucilaginibacter pocheonensis]